MKKILTTMMCIMLVLAFTACGGNERAETEPQDISLSLSTDENDIEYMQSSDLSVFGLERLRTVNFHWTSPIMKRQMKASQYQAQVS